LIIETKMALESSRNSMADLFLNDMCELQEELLKKELMKELSDKVSDIMKMKTRLVKMQTKCVSDLLQLLRDNYITQEQYVVLKEVIED